MSTMNHHIDGDRFHIITTPTAIVTTTKKAFDTVTPVPEKQPASTLIAPWGENNNFPAEVNADIYHYPLMSGVIDKKEEMLLSGGVRYGYVKVDLDTGAEVMVAKNDPVVNAFFRESRVEEQFLPEATRDWYTYANVFAEVRKNKFGTKITSVGCHDAGEVRLELMDPKSAQINHAYLADWEGGATEAEAIKLRVADPYRAVPKQVIDIASNRMILPMRWLGRGRRYYGITPWDGLRANGTVDIAKRIPLLKKLLLNNLMNLRYHIEVDERQWRMMFGAAWDKMSPDEKREKMDAYATLLDKWLRQEGVGGALSTTMIPSQEGNVQASMVKINEKRFTIPEGAYVEDWQETDFITCRDMGLKPTLYGISPSKSGSSPGSGSEDRIARTNHILGCRRDQHKLLEVLETVRDVNGWDPDYRFWFASYHAATLDRTNQVDAKPNAGPER